MSNRYKHIFSLYLRNPSFILISGIFLLSAIVSKSLYLFDLPSLAEDVATILFVGSLWLAFHVGLILKRQFANHRASLLPHYRWPHAHCVSIVCLLFVTVAVAWNSGLVPLVEISPHGMQGLYVLCLLVALTITCLGYLSIARAFIYGYVMLLALAIQSPAVISLLNESSYLKYFLATGCLAIIASLRTRLFKLTEEDFEYGYLLSWPPKAYIVNQTQANQLVSGLSGPFGRFPRGKERVSPIPRYPRRKHLLARANHWNYTETVNMKLVCFLLVIASPLYVIIMKTQPAIEIFFRNAYSNFLLLTITPVLVTVGSHYKKMGYWGYDLLKPIRKNQYMKERGAILIFHLLFYWFIFCLCFAVLPSYVFQPEVFGEIKYWGFMLLTGTFAFLVLSWLTLLSCTIQPRVVLLNGIVLSHIILFQFYFSSLLNSVALLWFNAICVMGGIALFNKAYFAWCQKEYD